MSAVTPSGATVPWPLVQLSRPKRQPVLAPEAARGPVLLRAARPSDVPAIAELLAGFAARGLLLPKSLEELYRGVRDFVVAVDAQGLVGCAALRVYSPVLAEVGSLAVAERAHGQGIGRRLVDALVADAAGLGIQRLFALTLEPAFFQRLGFETTSIEEFPAKVARDCAGCAKRSCCVEICVARDI